MWKTMVKGMVIGTVVSGRVSLWYSQMRSTHMRKEARQSEWMDIILAKGERGKPAAHGSVIETEEEEKSSRTGQRGSLGVYCRGAPPMSTDT